MNRLIALIVSFVNLEILKELLAIYPYIEVIHRHLSLTQHRKARVIDLVIATEHNVLDHSNLSAIDSILEHQILLRQDVLGHFLEELILVFLQLGNLVYLNLFLQASLIDIGQNYCYII